MGLDSAGNYKLYLPLTSGLNLLTSRDSDQTEHKDCEVREYRSPQFFVLISGSRAICLLVCLVSHTHLRYPISKKKKLAELLHVEKVTIPAYFVFSSDTCSLEGVVGGALTDHDTTLTSFPRFTT